MIERITSYFDWVYELPIEGQCHFAIGLSFVGFVFAAVVRETRKEPGVRFLARAIGAASFFAVAAFANHVSHEYEKLNFEMMVRKGQHASPIASGIAVVVPEKVVEFTTKKGTTVSWTELSGGRLGPVSIAGGRTGRSSSAVGQSGAVGAGTIDGFDDVSNAKHVEQF